MDFLLDTLLLTRLLFIWMRLPNKQTAINGLILTIVFSRVPPTPRVLFMYTHSLALVDVVIIDTNLQFPRLTGSLIDRAPAMSFRIVQELLLLPNESPE